MKYILNQCLIKKMKKFENIKKNLDLLTKNYPKLNSNLNRYNLILKSAVDSVKDPEDAQHVSELGDLTNINSLKQIKTRMQATEEGKHILSQKPRITEESMDFSNLNSYSENSLGYAYSKFMSRNDFSPNKRPVVKYIPDTDLAYISQRYKETHDFYHVLLNLDRRLIDEVAVKWFEAEHLRLSSSSLGGLFGSLTLSRQEVFLLYNKLLPGIIHIARSSKFLLGIYFEKRLKQDLSELRKELNIDITQIAKH